MHRDEEVLSTRLDVSGCLQAIQVLQHGYKKKNDRLFEKGMDMIQGEIDRSVLRKGSGVDQEIVEIKMQLAEKGKDIEYLKGSLDDAWMHINDVKKNIDLKFRHAEDHADKKVKEMKEYMEQSQRNVLISMSGIGALVVIAVTVVGFLINK